LWHHNRQHLPCPRREIEHQECVGAAAEDEELTSVAGDCGVSQERNRNRDIASRRPLPGGISGVQGVGAHGRAGGDGDEDAGGGGGRLDEDGEEVGAVRDRREEAERGVGDEAGGGRGGDERIGRGAERSERGRAEDAAGEWVDGKPWGEEEEGVEAVRGQEGVEGRGAEEAADSAGGGGDGEQLGDGDEGEDSLLEVRREGVPLAGAGGGGVGGGGGGGGGHAHGSKWGLVDRRFGFFSPLRGCADCAVEREMGTGARRGRRGGSGISLACGPRGAVFFFLFLRA